MKKVHIALGSLLLMAMITAFSLSPKTPAPTPATTDKETVKVLDWCLWFKFNTSYTIPNNTNTTPLGTATNYDDPVPVPDFTTLCPGGDKFCGVIVCAVLSGTPTPTNAQIATAVEAKRIAVGYAGFTHGLVWRAFIGAYEYEFTIKRKIV